MREMWVVLDGYYVLIKEVYNSINIDINSPWLISGFHRALLLSIIFISRLNALDYTKLIT